MKNRILLLLYLIMCLGFTSCDLYEIDNQEIPNVPIKGVLTYKGNPVPTKNGITPFAFYQDEYPLNGSFSLYTSQEGSVAGLIFDGTYQVKFVNGQGAFESEELEREIIVQGATDFKWEVIPFFWINSVDYRTQGRKVEADVDISKICDSKELEYVSLLFASSIICDRVNVEQEIRILSSDIQNLSNIHFDVDLSSWSKDYCYVRVGVKSEGNTYYNYSEVEKIEF